MATKRRAKILPPSRRLQPARVMTRASAAETKRRNTTRTRVLFAPAFSLFGRQSSYPGRIAPASMVGKFMDSAGYALHLAAQGCHAGGGTRTPTLFRAP